MKGRQIQYDPKELAWIEARKDWVRRDLHRAFVSFWMRPDVSFANFKALCTRKGWKTGRTGRIEKGAVPPNKGKPMSAATRAKVVSTMFKKGQRPHTYRGPGHESIDKKDGYVWIIVAERNPYTGADTRKVMKHRWLWEQRHGQLPKGMALKCLDGNRQNTDPTNWEAVSRGMLPRLNNRHGRSYDSAPAEVKPTLMLIAKVEHALSEAKL